MHPLVSIVTPVFNSHRYINEAYQSLLEQTHKKWEWLLVDDGSLSECHEALLGIANADRRVVLLRNHENLGAGKSRNKGIEAAKGSFIAFLDSDDRWMPSKIHDQIRFMDDGKNFCFTGFSIIEQSGLAVGKYIDCVESKTLSYRDALEKKATIGCSTVMLRAEAFDEIRMPDIRAGQDYACWLSLLRSGENVAYLMPVALTEYRITPGSLSRNKLKKARSQWRIYRDIEGLSFNLAIRCFFWYALHALLR